jgi:hypothetical protein
MKNFSHKICRENQFSIKFFENVVVFGIMWWNFVNSGKQQLKEWRMRIACWIPKSTNTHSEYVKKVKSTLLQASWPWRGVRGIAVPTLNLSTRRGWVVSTTPRPLYPRERTRYPLYGRLGGPQGRSGRVRKICPHRDFCNVLYKFISTCLLNNTQMSN